ncbi:glycosyltransferase [Mumia sp. zg.B21]|uniref:glycosyltransferase n=1 Tax=Mumia sp. zg.B21 TaxID=2855447 RepID=UPI001C6E4323|nr:glycosyltransferase [Mumia sp. zg.B21]MBW9209525.1 glycosyltransferase [Mumia sp. zg.B21]
MTPGVAPNAVAPEAPALPHGTYLSVARSIRLGKGGRTAALLMRARMLGEVGGRRSLVVTYDAYPGYDEVREVLVARGLLQHASHLVNLFEDYRCRSAADLGTGTDPLLPLAGTRSDDEERPDGSPGTRTHLTEGGTVEAVDHLRPDGTVFLRELVDPAGTAFLLVDHQERVVRRWRRRPAMVRAWLRELVPDGDVFVVTDSRFTVRIIRELTQRRFHVLEVVHNPHTVPDFRWDRPLQPTFRGVFDRLAELDGLVLLTERQRQDVALAFGPTNNLFTVPNPVWPATDTTGALRARDRFVVLGRLAAQKRVTHALDAFALARRSVGTATLSVYGDGDLRPALEEHARRLGVLDHATFHGHDPGARDTLETATALLVTSIHEGYPLGTLEAMSRGCPVIGYDVPYGMREQIQDGENGFLVEAGDVGAMAARMVTLAGDPGLVVRMSRAARQRAAEHAPERTLSAWATVFARVRDQRASRTRITACTLSRASLDVRRRLRPGGPRLGLDAAVTLTGTGPDPGPRTVEAFLDVAAGTGGVVRTPLRVSVTRDGIRTRGKVSLRSLQDSLGDEVVRARLVVVWQNSARVLNLAEGKAGQLRVSA